MFDFNNYTPEVVVRVACIVLPNNDAREKIAEACFRFTPQITLGERSIFLEIGGCRNLYSEHSLQLRVLALLKRFKVSHRFSIADDIPTALALALYNSRTKEQLPIDALKLYASPFKDTKVLDKPIVAFKRLGISHLGDLKEIPRSGIVSRFGKDGLIAAQYIESASHILWNRFVPPQKIIESSDIEETYRLFDLEPLLFLLKAQMDRALLRLRGAGKLASTVQVKVELEKYSHVECTERIWTIDLSFPQGAVNSLLPIIRERLSNSLQKTPLESHVRRLEFSITRAVFGNARQKDFFSKKEEETEALNAILARLTEKLGFDRAFFAQPKESYFPEKSWSKTLLESGSIKLRTPERPLRIMRNPIELRRIDNFFVFKKRKWRAVQMIGPERLSGDWWFKEAERDYFRVNTDIGEDLWVYQLPETKQYFLHGVFD